MFVWRYPPLTITPQPGRLRVKLSPIEHDGTSNVMIHWRQFLTTMLTKPIESFKSFLLLARPKADLSLLVTLFKDTAFVKAKLTKIHQRQMRVRVTFKCSFLAAQSAYISHNLSIVLVTHGKDGQDHGNFFCVAKAEVTIGGRVQRAENYRSKHKMESEQDRITLVISLWLNSHTLPSFHSVQGGVSNIQTQLHRCPTITQTGIVIDIPLAPLKAVVITK